MSISSSLIELKDIKFSYGDKTVLDIPSFHLSESERVFLFGPSGAGKTTLLEIIAGLSTAQSGVAKILGQDLSLMNEGQRDLFRGQNLAFIFQNFNLIPYLSVEENINLPRLLYKKKSDENLFDHIVKNLGLFDFLSKNVTELSVGQQQRVAAARALYMVPKIILADEPTSSLDYDHRHMFLNLLFELAAKTSSAILFVSHDRSLEKEFDRAVSLLTINQKAKGL